MILNRGKSRMKRKLSAVFSVSGRAGRSPFRLMFLDFELVDF